jgi:hypothetical protein
MSGIRRFVTDNLRCPPSVLVRYLAVYILVGWVLQMNADHIHIARFARSWQVVTMYGCVLVPLSLLLRRLPWHMQYAYSVVVIAPMDLAGFAIHSSVAYPGNILEEVFGPRSFTLAFVLIAAWIPARLQPGGPWQQRRECTRTRRREQCLRNRKS